LLLGAAHRPEEVDLGPYVFMISHHIAASLVDYAVDP